MTIPVSAANCFTAASTSPACDFTAGNYTVIASKSGYADNSQAVTILSSGPTTKDLPLSTVDLVITKSDGKVLAELGEHIAYVITVVNNGSIAANNLVVRDTPGANLAYISDTGPGNGLTRSSPFPDAGIYEWILSSLASGSSLSFTVTLEVTNIPTTVSNYVRVTTLSPENDTTNNEVSDIDTIDAHPDLVITKTDGATQVLAGDAVRYTISYQNVGNAAATGVTIVDTLVNGVEVDASKLTGVPAIHYEGSTPHSTYNAVAGTLTWDIGNLTVNGSGSITPDLKVKSTALPSSVVANRVVIDDDHLNGTDPNPANNTATDSDLVVAPYIVVEKTASGPAYTGQQLNYTINWRNTGTAAASNVVIKDTLPANMTAPTDISDGGTCDSGTRTITWNLTGAKAPDAYATLSYKVTPSVGAGGTTQPSATLYSVTGSGAACTSFPCTIATLHGGVVVQSDGSYIYTPTTGYKGLDSFTHIVHDDVSQSATATVSLTITPVANNDTGITIAGTQLNSDNPGTAQSVNNAQIVFNDIGTGITLYSVTGTGGPCTDFPSPCTITTLHGGVVVQSDAATSTRLPPATQGRAASAT